MFLDFSSPRWIIQTVVLRCKNETGADFMTRIRHFVHLYVKIPPRSILPLFLPGLVTLDTSWRDMLLISFTWLQPIWDHCIIGFSQINVLLQNKAIQEGFNSVPTCKRMTYLCVSVGMCIRVIACVCVCVITFMCVVFVWCWLFIYKYLCVSELRVS